MSDVPEDAPAHCPGTASTEAGRASACAGCPNQRLCQSGAANTPDPDVAVIADKLSTVRHKLVVLSGKGGVGKSSVSALLSLALSLDESKNVGLVDTDVCGPSIPTMMGVMGEEVHTSSMGWQPVYVEDNLALMSIAFVLPSPDAAVIWRGPKKNGMIKQFLKDVHWGDLDYLIIDTPPGTSDEHLSVTSLLADAKIDGAIIVTTPQEVSLSDVRKQINFCHKVKLPVIGVVSNMDGFVCPSCHGSSEIFPANTGGVEKMARDMNVPFLGAIPVDPRLARACDEGTNFVADHPESPTAKAIAAIVDRVRKTVESS